MTAPLETEFPFKLPKGYIDQDGNLHREGSMRLATAADEILPGGDPRVLHNPAYHTIITLSRCIKLGNTQVNTRVIESLFVSDLAYLRALYEKINGDGHVKIPTVCPKCENKFEVELTNSE